MRTRLTLIALLATLLVLPSTLKAAPFYIGSSPLVPPTDGVYVSPADVHAQYDVGGVPVILRDIRHGNFTNIVRTPSLVPLGTNETFDSIVFGNVSIGGGPFMPISLAGSVQVFLFGYSPGDTGTFDTEMLALSLTGVGVPVSIRESPTLASLGKTTIQDLGSGGPYRIDSFFDVFTEITLDGGQSWVPSLGPTRVDLSNIPLPAAWLMFLSGLGLLGAVRGHKKQIAA